MGESRGELLAWINSLFGVGYTKVEQCGSGSVYCQILDCIYGDIPLTKVNPRANQEYQYLNNFKVLQKGFRDKGIDKPIPVDKLVKCKMQDNLEFLQWMHKFWYEQTGGAGYDPGARAPPPAAAPRAAARVNPAAVRGNTPTGGARVGAGARAAVGASRSSSGVGASAQTQAQLAQAQAQVEEMMQHSVALEKERDFYFAKLRDVEVIIQTRLNEPEDKVGAEERGILASIQTILYDTEEGFETPAEQLEGLELGEDDLQGEEMLHHQEQEGHANGGHPDVDDTF